jgi:hypothetical protein
MLFSITLQGVIPRLNRSIIMFDSQAVPLITQKLFPIWMLLLAYILHSTPSQIQPIPETMRQAIIPTF